MLHGTRFSVAVLPVPEPTLPSFDSLLRLISGTRFQFMVTFGGAQRGYSPMVLDDSHVTADEASKGRLQSQWAASVPSDDVPAFGAIQWKPFEKQTVIWTDDHSSVVAVLPWSRFLPANLGSIGTHKCIVVSDPATKLLELPGQSLRSRRCRRWAYDPAPLAPRRPSTPRYLFRTRTMS